LPPPGAPDEYAALFEAVYPSEADRRTYIASKVSGAKPSYGHVALATMMRGGLARLAWTTNFDPLIADGCAKVYGGTGQLTTVPIETGSLGRQVIDEGRWPRPATSRALGLAASGLRLPGRLVGLQGILQQTQQFCCKCNVDRRPPIFLDTSRKAGTTIPDPKISDLLSALEGAVRPHRGSRSLRSCAGAPFRFRPENGHRRLSAGPA
jgi:hypothetical protein